MRKIFSFVAVTIAALSLSLASCTKDPAKAVSVDMSEGKTANISGTLLVNPNLSASPQTYKGMETKIMVSVPYSEIFNNPQAKGSWSTMITSNSNGEFSVTVPASVSGVNVSFTASDVRGEQRQNSSTTFKGVWKFNISSENVKSGKTVVKEATIGTFTKLAENGSEI